MSPAPTRAHGLRPRPRPRLRPWPRAENKRHRVTTADVIARRHFADAHKFDASCKRRAAQATQPWKTEVEEHTTLAARECATRPTR